MQNNRKNKNFLQMEWEGMGRDGMGCHLSAKTKEERKELVVPKMPWSAFLFCGGSRTVKLFFRDDKIFLTDLDDSNITMADF